MLRTTSGISCGGRSSAIAKAETMVTLLRRRPGFYVGEGTSGESRCWTPQWGPHGAIGKGDCDNVGWTGSFATARNAEDSTKAVKAR